MEVHGPGGISGPSRIDINLQPQRPPEVEANQQVPDRAEISEEARLLSKLAEVPEVRTERVHELRELIAAGQYETAERIAGTVEKLLEEL
jgi:anti-sigma28 factor (negative regulator of flagellin synthesis)